MAAHEEGWIEGSDAIIHEGVKGAGHAEVPEGAPLPQEFEHLQDGRFVRHARQVFIGHAAGRFLDRKINDRRQQQPRDPGDDKSQPPTQVFTTMAAQQTAHHHPYRYGRSVDRHGGRPLL